MKRNICDIKRAFPFLLICILFLTFQSTSFAQNVPQTFGSRASALGNAAVNEQSVFSVFSNQAGLAELESTSAALFIENRFLISELQLGGLAVALPTKSGTFGIGANYYGFENFSQQHFALSYGRKLFEDKLSIGASFNYLLYNLADFGNASGITFGIGVQYQIEERIRVAAHVFNPLRVQLVDNPFADDFVETTMKVGINFVPSEKVEIVLEAAKSVHFPAEFRGGIEYHPIDKLVFRGGFATLPSALVEGRFGGDLAMVSFGLGVDLKVIQIDLASRFHPQLGHTPSVSLIWLNQSKKTEVPVEDGF